ncbi:MAG TPA: glycosyltransferase [Gemmatimonadales bacterium]|nr:glycosyltransferase [Gemmatimonadales bacterium]
MKLADRTIRALHIFTPARAGGLESVVEMLLPGLAQRGVAVAASAVIGAGEAEPPCLGVLRAAGLPVEVHRLGARAYGSELRAHRAIIAGFHANLVHTHGYRADVLGGLAAGPQLPRVATVHGFTGGDWKNRLYEWLQVRAYRRFDGVVAVSRLLRDQLQRRGVGAGRLELIPNAFQAQPLASRAEARAALGLRADGLIIGWVGRFSREKAPDLFLRAAAAIPGARFALVGDGPEREALQVLANQLGIAGRVDWPGLVAGAGRYYRAFDAFVLSSRTEGTPIALFEAMAAQVPVVATAVGGVPEVIDRATGHLVPPEQPTALAEAIGAILAEPAAATALAANARQKVDRDYALLPWIDRYRELYARVLG